MTAAQDLAAALVANQEAAVRALERNDMVAYRALAEQEARYLDTLRAMGLWSDA